MHRLATGWIWQYLLLPRETCKSPLLVAFQVSQKQKQTADRNLFGLSFFIYLNFIYYRLHRFSFESFITIHPRQLRRYKIRLSNQIFSAHCKCVSKFQLLSVKKFHSGARETSVKKRQEIWPALSTCGRTPLA